MGAYGQHVLYQNSRLVGTYILQSINIYSNFIPTGVQAIVLNFSYNKNMTIEKGALLLIGSLLIFLSIKLFIFFLKGGGFEIGISTVGTRDFKPKNNATKSDQLNLIFQAILFFVIGVALFYTNFP